MVLVSRSGSSSSISGISNVSSSSSNDQQRTAGDDPTIVGIDRNKGIVLFSQALHQLAVRDDPTSAWFENADAKKNTW